MQQRVFLASTHVHLYCFFVFFFCLGEALTMPKQIKMIKWDSFCWLYDRHRLNTDYADVKQNLLTYLQVNIA